MSQIMESWRDFNQTNIPWYFDNDIMLFQCTWKWNQEIDSSPTISRSHYYHHFLFKTTTVQHLLWSIINMVLFYKYYCFMKMYNVNTNFLDLSCIFYINRFVLCKYEEKYNDGIVKTVYSKRKKSCFHNKFEQMGL